jgi:hypothetical protein
MAQQPMRVDKSALKTNQICIVALLFIAFLIGNNLGGQALAAATALAMTIGVLVPEQGPFRLLYRRVLKPAGLLKPRVEPDDPRPHRFALALGAAFAWASFLALISGLTVVGWALAWTVIILAFINLTVNFCAGCFIYYQLNKVGLLRGSA